MRYPGAEKLEIIRLVEQSPLPVRRTLATLGILPGTFYRWYERLQTGGPEALEDGSPRPRRVWNRIPDAVREQVVQLALDEPDLSPRELATRFTDTRKYFVSEASVYRLLKAQDMIASPAYVVIKAADEFKDKTTAPNQLWQTDFRLGLVLPVDHPRRLLALHHRLEAVHDDEGRGCDRHAGAGAAGIGDHDGTRRSSTAAAIRQRLKLPLGRPRPVAR